jgi:hypothetical protein
MIAGVCSRGSMEMFRDGDSLVFQRVTGCLRKPIVRFALPSGREIELLSFHLEPGWAFGGESPRPIAEEVVRRLYPNERPVFVGEQPNAAGSSWLCVAYLYSDTPVRSTGVSNYSVLLICGFVKNVDVGVRDVVCELLAAVDWESVASEDAMW